MKQKRILAMLLTTAMLLLGATALAAGGTAEDPLVSRSYLQQIFTTPIQTYLSTAKTMLEASLSQKLQGLTTAADAYLNSRWAARLGDTLYDRVSQRVSQKLAAGGAAALSGGMQPITLKKGDHLTGKPGSSFILLSGSGVICGGSGTQVLNATVGDVRAPGSATRTGILYLLLAADGSGLQITSSTAVALVADGAGIAGAYTPKYTAYADALKQLGLFQGSDKGYELARTPNRMEALILLIRLLGEEPAALSYTGSSTFTDLTGWTGGFPYVAYGQNRGYTNGTSATRFGQGDDTTLEQYLTFVLRSLGYRDGVDFQWDTTSAALAQKLGLLTQAETAAIRTTGFLRDHVALISFRALSAPLQDGSGTLGARLVRAGVMTEAQLRQALSSVS